MCVPRPILPAAGTALTWCASQWSVRTAVVAEVQPRSSRKPLTLTKSTSVGARLAPSRENSLYGFSLRVIEHQIGVRPTARDENCGEWDCDIMFTAALQRRPPACSPISVDHDWQSLSVRHDVTTAEYEQKGVLHSSQTNHRRIPGIALPEGRVPPVDALVPQHQAVQVVPRLQSAKPQGQDSAVGSTGPC